MHFGKQYAIIINEISGRALYAERIFDMKWTRKTKEFEYADYVSENGKYRVRDMSINAHEWFKENGKRGFWWGLIGIDDNGNETIIKANFKTAKAAKEYAEAL